jgi:hypothetical protein
MPAPSPKREMNFYHNRLALSSIQMYYLVVRSLFAGRTRYLPHVNDVVLCCFDDVIDPRYGGT